MASGNPEIAGGAEGAEAVIQALLGPVLVHSPVLFVSDGAIERQHVLAVMSWLSRDIDRNLIERSLAIISKGNQDQSFSRLSLQIAEMISKEQELAEKSAEAARRLQIQIGGEEVFSRLRIIESAFRNYQLLEKAVAYGRAINGINDENSMKMALQTFPLDDPMVSVLMMQAAIGQIANPVRLMCAVMMLSEGQTQKAVSKAGFSPIVDAMFAHAQNQMAPFMEKDNRFADIDLICRSLDRYHRLIRAISNITENDKGCRWAQMVAAIVRRMSELIEPRLGRVDSDIRQALRKPRTGPDVIDAGLLLDALNGLYLLASVREALDALALNSLVTRLWSDVGKVLEVLIDRNLEAFKNFPEDEAAAKRLDTSIKMAKVRFNPEYAGIIIRARDGATRRAAG